MSESVVRHRGARRDEDGKLIPASDVTLKAFAVAPAGGSHYGGRGRGGRVAKTTVYFTRQVDLVSDDELTVRGERYQIVVNPWRSPWSGRGGVEVLCDRGQG